MSMFLSYDYASTPWKTNMLHSKMEVEVDGRWFSFPIGWISGSMLIFRRCKVFSISIFAIFFIHHRWIMLGVDCQSNGTTSPFFADAGHQFQGSKLPRDFTAFWAKLRHEQHVRQPSLIWRELTSRCNCWSEFADDFGRIPLLTYDLEWRHATSSWHQ